MSGLDDPRVFLSAERSALAWNRTSITLMAFGVAIARFGLFAEMVNGGKTAEADSPDAAFWFGLVFVGLGFLFSLAAAKQFRTILKTLKPKEIPQHINPSLALWVNYAIAALAAALGIYLAVFHFK